MKKIYTPEKLVHIPTLKTQPWKEQAEYWKSLKDLLLIGAARAGGICDCEGSFNSPFYEFCDYNGIVERKKTTGMYMGKIMEDALRKNLNDFLKADKLPVSVKVINDNHLYRSTKNPFQIGEIDGWVWLEGYDGVGILEIKTSNSFYGPVQWEGDKTPMPVKLQVAQYLNIHPRASFVVILGYINGTSKARIFTREEMAENIELVIEKEREFLEKYLIPGNLPDPSGSERDNKVIMDYIGVKVVKDPIQLDESIVGVILEYQKIGKYISAMGKQRDALKNKLWLALDGHLTGMIKGKPVLTEKEIFTTRISVDLVKKAGKYDEFSTKSSYKKLGIDAKYLKLVSGKADPQT